MAISLTDVVNSTLLNRNDHARKLKELVKKLPLQNPITVMLSPRGIQPG
ncbi:TPA: hypothetical protein P7Z51_004955 [Citrobacter amalonaticus]|nr:hypothetical protein [Citrobacter amalonaticus]